MDIDDSRKASKKPLRHLIAINRHPYHEPDRVAFALNDYSKIVPKIRAHFHETLDIILFWHGDNIPPHIQTLAASMGIATIQMPHSSNGTNINLQIEYANKQAYDIFFRADADDTVKLDRFICQSQILASSDADIVGASLQYKTSRGDTFLSCPPQRPTRRDFLENRYVLHPTMAFRLTALNRVNLRYWTKRLEDKELLLRARKLGLVVQNVPVLGGDYFLSAGTRSDLSVKHGNLVLNMCFLFNERAPHLMPYALVLFVFHLSLGSEKMRFIRSLSDRVLDQLRLKKSWKKFEQV